MKIYKALPLLILLFLPSRVYSMGLNPSICMQMFTEYNLSGQYNEQKIDECSIQLNTTLNKLSLILKEHIPSLSPEEIEWYKKEGNSSFYRSINAEYSKVGIKAHYKSIGNKLETLSNSYKKLLSGESKSYPDRILYFSQTLQLMFDFMNTDKLKILVEIPNINTEFTKLLHCNSSNCKTNEDLINDFNLLKMPTSFLHIIQHDANIIKSKP